jgi:hypothetical protein
MNATEAPIKNNVLAIFLKYFCSGFWLFAPRQSQNRVAVTSVPRKLASTSSWDPIFLLLSFDFFLHLVTCTGCKSAAEAFRHLVGAKLNRM